MNFTKTILNGVKVWVESKFNSLNNWIESNFITHNPQTLTDTQKQQTQQNIGIIAATDQDIIDLMLDMGMMPVVQDSDGTILVDSDNTIILT